jgi:hypothetical protein
MKAMLTVPTSDPKLDWKVYTELISTCTVHYLVNIFEKE